VGAPLWSKAEIELLARLISEGHTPLSTALVMNRSPLAVKQKAYQRGLCFRGKLGNDGVKFYVTVERQTFDTLRAVAREIEVTPHRLARIILNCIAQQNMWARILRLSDDEDGQ
jgi:hypothetical protein